MNFFSCRLMATACCVILALSTIAQAQTKSDSMSAADRIARATEKINSKQTWSLKHKLQKGETVRWSVEHVASTKTRMSGETEETSSRSVSVKAWKVSDVDDKGHMTFVHTIESVDMWQKIGDTDPVAYNSRTDKTTPPEYQSVADKLNKTLATIRIAPNGTIEDRKSDLRGARFGVGDVTVPFPDSPITIGHRWNVPTSLPATDEDGLNHQLKARIVYELMKVKSGNAYISFRTEVLTPVESEKIKSQIMQQMTKGFVVFNIPNGRLVRKEVEWDEKVQGYEGPDSFLQYLGRMTEKLLPAGSTADQAKGSSPLKPLK